MPQNLGQKVPSIFSEFHRKELKKYCKTVTAAKTSLNSRAVKEGDATKPQTKSP